MSTQKDFTKYDNVLSSLLVEEGSILGFLSAIFNFLGRRTDFYYISKNPNDNVGFPPGVAEQLVLKVLRACNPSHWPTNPPRYEDINNEIMCSTVAQEVEVVAEGDDVDSEETSINCDKTDDLEFRKQPLGSCSSVLQSQSTIIDDYTPPVIPSQKNSDSYNGAVREGYSWSQSITEIDVTMKLPVDIKSAKDLKLTIHSGDITIMKRTGELIIKDSFPYKIKGSESMWSVSEGKLLIHLEKVQERWWTRLLSKEEEIDLSKVDCSRPLDELPEDHIEKIKELQWNEQRKLQGLPTSEDIKKLEILKKAWNAEGSPFKGQDFDTSKILMK